MDLKEEPFSFSSLNVDIYGRCNLQCRYCPEGTGLNEQPVRQMSFALFQRWIGPLLPGLRHLELFNWSEPLLHKELFDVLDWAAQRNPDLALRLSTNGTLIDQDIAERIIYSPIQSVTVTIASLTREAYLHYHRVDALDRVINSLRHLAFAKERHGSSTPRIRLRYLRFPFNLVSTSEVRRWLKTHLRGYAPFVDKVTVREGYLCGSTLCEDDIERVYGMGAKDLSSISLPLYPLCQKTPPEPSVRADGAVFPCCAVPYSKEYIMGFLGNASFREIWNGTPYRRFRESLMEGKNPVCNSCHLRYPNVPIRLDRHVFQRLHSRVRKRKSVPPSL
jgi:radical SAM protein with 4Fe4S-binding SPASM domain